MAMGRPGVKDSFGNRSIGFFSTSCSDDVADEDDHVMFRGVKHRHHVAADESASFVIEQASRRLAEKLNLKFAAF